MKNDMITTEQAVQELSKALKEFGNAAGSAIFKNFGCQLRDKDSLGDLGVDPIKRR